MVRMLFCIDKLRVEKEFYTVAVGLQTFVSDVKNKIQIGKAIKIAPAEK